MMKSYPVVRHDDWTDQNNTTNYQFENKMTKYLRKLKAKRMYFIKKGRTEVVLFTFVFLSKWSTEFQQTSHHLTVKSL